MPGGDGTGPLGRGRRTGRGAGYCSGYSAPGFANPNVPRGGFGFGRGFGRGFWGRGRRFFWQYDDDPYDQPLPNYRYAPVERYSEPESKDERRYLEDMSRRLEDELKEIKERLSKLSDK